MEIAPVIRLGYNLNNEEQTVETSKPPSFLSFLPTALILLVIGWGGLAVLILALPPDLGPRWLFFFLLTLALTGTFLPVVYFFHRRFPVRPPVEGGVILRESLWFGIYASALTWLQLGKMLNVVMAIFLAGILVLIEGLLRMWERSRWKPGP
jgi:hypothetical protein